MGCIQTLNGPQVGHPVPGLGQIDESVYQLAISCNMVGCQ